MRFRSGNAVRTLLRAFGLFLIMIFGCLGVWGAAGHAANYLPELRSPLQQWQQQRQVKQQHSKVILHLAFPGGNEAGK